MLVWEMMPVDMIVLSINGTEEPEVNAGECSFIFKRFIFLSQKKKECFTCLLLTDGEEMQENLYCCETHSSTINKVSLGWLIF